MNNIQEILRAFNLRGYSDVTVAYADNGKDGKILTLLDGGWKYEDEFYGGEPYSGNETIWFEDKVVFRCVYYGRVAKGEDFAQMYGFLREALTKGPDTGVTVHRGPKQYEKGELLYTNESTGTIENFELIERIFKNGKEVYSATFLGGLVNVQK